MPGATAASGRLCEPSGSKLAAGHLSLDLALGLYVGVDSIAQFVGRRRVEVDLLLEYVAEPPARHPDVVQILHEHERVHRRQVAGFIHQLHASIVLACE